jgi:hypothetical protein
MPFGIKNSPSHFQRMMDIEFRKRAGWKMGDNIYWWYYHYVKHLGGTSGLNQQNPKNIDQDEHEDFP